MLKKITTILLIALFIAYPLIVYFGLSHLPISILGTVLLVLFSLRMGLLFYHHGKEVAELLPMALGVGGVLFGATLLKSEQLLLFVPVVMNGVFLLNFGSTLFKGPTMVARFAALAGDEITENVERYCYRVTLIWSLFFIANGLVSLYMALFATREMWTLYTGMISYILMGTLMGGEYLVRIRFKRKEAQNQGVIQ